MKKENSIQIPCTNPNCGYINDTATVEVHTGSRRKLTDMINVPWKPYKYVWCKHCGRMLDLPNE